MRKQFTIADLVELLNTNPQWLYKIINKPIPGEIWDPTNPKVNYDELKKFLLRKYDNNENQICEIFDIESLDDIEIVKKSKSQMINTNKVAIDDLELDNHYFLKSYHYKLEYILRSVIEVNEDMIYIFEEVNSSKSTKDKYRSLTINELSQDRFTIEKA